MIDDRDELREAELQRRALVQNIQVYDTKSNPRVKWTCIKCGQRNDAFIVIPIDTVIIKHCKKCKTPMKMQKDKNATPQRALFECRACKKAANKIDLWPFKDVCSLECVAVLDAT